MREIFLRYMLLVVVAVAAMACSNEWWNDQFDDVHHAIVSDAELSLVIETSATQTRVGIAAADDAAAAGDKMNSLTMLLVRPDNTIERRVDVPSNKADEEISSFNAKQDEASIKLYDVERGEHTIYLVSNYTLDANTYKVGANVATLGLDDALLPTLTGTATPDHEAPMPMTAKVEVELKQGTNNVSAELERVVGRFGVTFYDHVSSETFAVVITNAQLSSFNPSSGYLFNHNYTVPASNVYRPFYSSISGPVRLSHLGDATPIDTYLYETDSKASYELSFLIGVFENLPAGTLPTATTTTAPNITDHNAFVINHKYLIYNYAQGCYLYMNGESLALSSTVPNTDYDDYLWTFSSTAAGKIKNVGTGRWISRSGATLGTTDSEVSAETFTKGNQGTGTFYLRSSYYSSSQYYFLQAPNTSSVSLYGSYSSSTNYNQALWSVREMETTPVWSGASAIKSFYHSAPLTFINELGAPEPLVQIDRNENIQVGVNVFYNTQTGSFNYDVVPWREVSGDITFD